MSRILSILLLLIYSSVQAVGLSFSLHYCGDSLTHISILDTEPDCCCVAVETTTEDNCCGDELVYAKIDNEHAASSQPLNTIKWAYVQQINSSNPFTLQCTVCSKATTGYYNTGPPLPQQQSWLFFNVLRL